MPVDEREETVPLARRLARIRPLAHHTRGKRLPDLLDIGIVLVAVGYIALAIAASYLAVS